MSAPTTTPTVADIRAVNDPPGVDNPYWEQVRQLPTDHIRGRIFPDEPWTPDSLAYIEDDSGQTRISRQLLVHRFSWAITDPVSVTFVAEHCAGFTGLFEVGAGSGYWAWQLAQRGVDVIAVDESPPDIAANFWCQENWQPDGSALRPTFHPVGQSGTYAAKDHPSRVLFLCWPPNGSPMAKAALDFYTGTRVIYIGDDECCAEESFRATLSEDWAEVACHQPVRWSDIRDVIHVYDRKVAGR